MVGDCKGGGVLSICLRFILALLYLRLTAQPWRKRCLSSPSPPLTVTVNAGTWRTPWLSSPKRRRSLLSPLLVNGSRQKTPSPLALCSTFLTPLKLAKLWRVRLRRWLQTDPSRSSPRTAVLLRFRCLFADGCSGSNTCVLVLWLVTWSSSENRTHPSLFQRTE